MNHLTRRAMILGTAATAASAGLLTACGSGSGSGSGASDAGGGGAVIRVDNREPENPLIPTNTSELAGGSVLTACFACLSYYTVDGTVANDAAESIESEDQQNWTIKIRSGQTFSDGSAVTAKSFVDAWNYGALATNAQVGQSFFSPIEGFDAVAAENPTAETMSGLQVVDDTTFTVKLTSPQSDFPLRLGYWAYAPLPEAGLKDMEAFGKKPISNGPYTVKAWTNNESIEIVKNPDYDGPRAAKNDGVTFTVYQDVETAYNDLVSDELDVLGSVPTSALETFEDELGDRAVNQPGATLIYMGIPSWSEQFSGEAGALRRQAVSRAIDRKAICDGLFFGTRVPATDFVAPAVKGGGATDIPGGEVLQYDAAAAKDLWAQAEEISPSGGKVTMAYNADGANKDWVEAVLNSIKNTLGVEIEPRPFPSFGEYKKLIADHTIDVPFRQIWVADYPSAFNFLYPLFATDSADGKGGNQTNYKNPELDALLVEMQEATDEAGALEKAKAAQAILMQDLPLIPLWYQNNVGGYSQSMSDVEFTWNGSALYSQMVKE